MNRFGTRLVGAMATPSPPAKVRSNENLDKIDMSLDDIIKLNRKEGKKQNFPRLNRRLQQNGARQFRMRVRWGIQQNSDLFYLFESQSYTERRGRQREVFHPLVHSPDGCNGRSCANPKPGARSFFRVSHTGAGAQGLWPSSAAFPGHTRELDWKRSSRDYNRHPYGMWALQAGALTPLCHSAGPLDTYL